MDCGDCNSYGGWDDDDYRYEARRIMPEGRSLKDKTYYNSRISGKSQFEQRLFEKGKVIKKGKNK